MNKIKTERDECHTSIAPNRHRKQDRSELLLHIKHPINMNLNLKTVS